MPFEHEIGELNGIMAVRAVSEMLRRVDERLVDHGERVAFIACELFEEATLPIDEETLFLLAVFHDIGAYKTDEIDRMLDFEIQNVWNHSIYGYLFLKHMTPLNDKAEAVLYHHTPWDVIKTTDPASRIYAGIIHFADRIDILAQYGTKKAHFDQLCADENRLFSPELIALFLRCFQKRRIFERLADGSYHETNMKRIKRFQISPRHALEYLKMLVYSIDFRSRHTVSHTISTISIALYLAQHFNLDIALQEKIYLGALLHDIGKIAIPHDILERPGRLSPEEMTIMRTHVVETEVLIRDIVPEEICQIAIRHHEKLDGSGYPHGLNGNELDFNQRIVAVADVVSALASRRSYKDPFPKEKTIAILREMGERQLDRRICNFVCECYDQIMQDTDSQRSAVIQNYQLMMREFEQLQIQFQ